MKCKNVGCLITEKLWKDGFCSLVCRNKVKCVNPISGYRKCLYCEKTFPYRNTAKVRSSYSVRLKMFVGSAKQKYCSLYCSLMYRNKHINPSKSLHARKAISDRAKLRGVSHMHTKEAHLKKSKSITGKRHWNWQGGKTSDNRKARNVTIYKEWRKAVFERDKYTCVFCGDKSKKGNPVILNADHIKPFAYFPELRYKITNGRTLCLGCHKKTDTYAGKKSCHRVASRA